eukprot:s96_g2.t1
MAMAWLLLLLLCLGELPEANSKSQVTELATVDDTALGGIQLCREVSALRSDLPAYVVKLGHLYEARQSLSKKRRLRLREHNDSSPLWSSPAACVAGTTGGPWRLKIDLAAPSTAPTAFRKHHRAILVFGKTWPQSLPSIRFVGQLKYLGLALMFGVSLKVDALGQRPVANSWRGYRKLPVAVPGATFCPSLVLG